MDPSRDSRQAATSRILPLRARGDLESIETAFGGEQSYIVKDPVAGESFHLSALEHRLLTAMRRPTSLRALQRIIETEFAPRQATIAQLQQFVVQLYDQGLLLSENPGQAAELAARGEKRRRRGRWTSLLQVLAIRLGSFDAGPFVDRLYRAVAWAFTPAAAVAAAIVVGYAAILVLGHADELAARLPALGELTQTGRLPLWLAAIAGVKILHELGHALACRHFGARPQEIGVMLLAGAPALYCDASDAWRLPSKRQRMAVSAAGMVVELVIAAAATIVWRHAAPGVLSTLSLSLIIVCSVGTLLVNANPLLRYDGYYLLADWLEVPNLAERARGLLTHAWRSWLLGEPAAEDPFVGAGKRRALWVYAILSKLYLAAVLIGVFALALKLARPRGLENVVYAVAALVVSGLLLPPAMAVWSLATNPSLRSRVKRPRVTATVAASALALAAVWWWPVIRRIEAPFVAMPARAHSLFAVSAGELRWTAPEGSWVEAGEAVARLSNPDMELALAEQQGAVRERRARLDQLNALRGSMPSAARLVPTAAAELADAEAQLVEQQALVDSLVIRAPTSGRVLAPPARRQDPTEGVLPSWHGSPLDARNRGAWIEAGTPLAVVAAPGPWVAWAGVDQADAPVVDAGQRARALVDEQPATLVRGTVAQVGRRARDNRSVGDMREQREDSVADDERYYVVEIALEAPPAWLFAGARGTAQIATDQSTVGKLAMLRLRRLLQRVF